MNYLPTIDLWNRGIHSALVSGQLRLQSGQWVRCGTGKPSRFIGVKNGIIDAVHWQGSAKATNSKFLIRARLARLQVQYSAGRITSLEMRDAGKELMT